MPSLGLILIQSANRQEDDMEVATLPSKAKVQWVKGEQAEACLGSTKRAVSFGESILLNIREHYQD